MKIPPNLAAYLSTAAGQSGSTYGQSLTPKQQPMSMPEWFMQHSGPDLFSPFLARGGSIRKGKRANVAEVAPELLQNSRTGEQVVVTDPSTIENTGDGTIDVKPIAPDPFQGDSLNVGPSNQPQLYIPSQPITSPNPMPGQVRQAPVGNGLSAPQVMQDPNEFNFDRPYNELANDARYQGKVDELGKAVNTPAQKQKPWKQALWFALQGVRETLRPGTGNMNYLGQAQKNYKVDNLKQEVGTLGQIRQADQAFRAGDLNSMKAAQDLKIGAAQEARAQREFDSQTVSTDVNGRLLQRGAHDPNAPLAPVMIQNPDGTLTPAVNLTKTPYGVDTNRGKTYVTSDQAGTQALTNEANITLQKLRNQGSYDTAEVRGNSRVNPRLKSFLDNVENNSKLDTQETELMNENKAISTNITRIQGQIGVLQKQLANNPVTTNIVGKTQPNKERDRIQSKIDALQKQLDEQTNKLDLNQGKIESIPKRGIVNFYDRNDGTPKPYRTREQFKSELSGGGLSDSQLNALYDDYSRVMDKKPESASKQRNRQTRRKK